MAKRIFINNLDTYVSQAIFSELRNDTPDDEGQVPDDAHVMFGTYITKDSSIKPEGVKKMLKVGLICGVFVVTENDLCRDLNLDLR